MTLFFSGYRKFVARKQPNLGRRWVVYEFMTVCGVMRFVGKVKVVCARPDKIPKTPMGGDVRPGQIGTLASATQVARQRQSPTGTRKGKTG